jgi:hypothetical protein
MGLFGVAPEVMKPTALSLNILVAGIATFKFLRVGLFSQSTFWPFALGSIPAAFIGGQILLPGHIYKPVVGVVLLYAAISLLRTSSARGSSAIRTVHRGLALTLGVVIGLLSGMTGVGGGIFLSPLLILKGWAEIRQTAGISAAFIFVNSISGLLGHLSSASSLPRAIPLWALAAVAGGIVGAEYGSKRLNTVTLRRFLAVVLIIAALKTIFI